MNILATNQSSLVPSRIFIIRLVVLLLISTVSFGQKQEDSKTKDLVAKCEKSMGGKKAYEKTRHISWTFFGFRTLWWDKHTGDVRIENPKEKTVLLWNSKTGKGQAIVDGKQISDTGELDKMMDKARGTWINDSYWLVMPFKLNDPGVNKKYLGEKKTAAGKTADVIELTFNEVGVTPQNKYHIYFDQDSHLVSQWDFYRNASDEKPGFAMPWQDYLPYGKILLSGDRGERKLSNIMVAQKVEESTYTVLTPISF